MSYATEQKAGARTPQAILTLGVPYCANFYATSAIQTVQYTDDFSNAAWTKGGTPATVTANTHASPDPDDGASLLADTLTFPAVNDFVQQDTGYSVTSKAYTGSVWLRSTSGTGTITIKVQNTANTQSAILVCSLTTTWQRFSLHKLFTGVPVDTVVFKIYRDTTDLSAVVAWRANMSLNLGAVLDLLTLFPSVKRTNELDTTPAVLASRCQAADAGDGLRCYYTMPTCQDPAHYNPGNSYEATAALRGIREYKICRKDAPAPVQGLGIAPLLERYDQAAQEIPTRAGTTRDERTTYHLYDDAGPGVWDVVKQSEGAKVNTARGAGSLFRRFLAIHKNYSNPLGYAKLAVGYVFYGNPGTPHTEADYRQRLKGPILNVKLDPRGHVEIEAGDTLASLKKKIPTKISSTNLLDGSITSGATSLVMDDASEIDEPPLDGSYPVVIQIDSEKMNVTARDLTTNTLTVQRGRWGTTAAAHANNAAVTALVEFGTEQVTPANQVLGINIIDALVQLLRRAGLPAADINTTTLNDERDTWLVSGIDTTNGTQNGKLFRRTISEPIEIDKLIFGESELCDSAGMNVFVDEDQRVTGKVFAPPKPTDTIYELTDAAHFVAESVEIEDDNEARISRAVYAWDLLPGAKGDAVEDFAKARIRILSDEEARGYFGAPRDRIILSKWLSGLDTGTASAVTGRLCRRFRSGARFVGASLEAKDDDNVKLGSYVYVSTAWLQKPDGSTDTKRIMQVVKKVQLDQETGRMAIRCLDTALLKRVMFIAPNGQPDYDSATIDQKKRGYIGDAQNRVGVAKEEGYVVA